MKRVFAAALVIAALLLPSTAGAGESLMRILLRVTGLTAAPQTKAADDTVEPGDIWVVSLDGVSATPLTTGGGYRSPIFSGADGSILALKGDALVRIANGGGGAAPLSSVTGIVKLVGFDSGNADELIVLLEAQSSPLGVLSLKSGKVTPLDYDGKSDIERRMLAQIRGQERIYGDTSIYVQTETKRGLSRTIEWTNVYLRHGNLPPRNVSQCDGVSCAQPVLSPDGRRVAFVKTGE